MFQQQLDTLRAAKYHGAHLHHRHGCALHFFVDAEEFYENYSISKDKEFVTFAGLVHGITPCGNCPGGPYTNQVTNYWNYLYNWITTRFGN